MHNHDCCTHSELKHCEKCDVVYCSKCSKEWGSSIWIPNVTFTNDGGSTLTGYPEGCHHIC